MQIIDKNSREYIAIQPTSYEGSSDDLIDIRVYKKTRNEPTGYRTHKGLTIQRQKVGDLITALEAVK